MRIVSWNPNRATWSSRRRFESAEAHRFGTWTALRDLGADIALVQEAPSPPEALAEPPLATLPEHRDLESWRSRPGPSRWWCSAIATWGPPLRDFHAREGYRSLDETHQGAYRVGTIPWREHDLVLVSLYALWDYAGLAEGAKPRYSETLLHRSLSDLTPILDQHPRNHHQIIVAGDFNASTQFPAPYRDAYRIVHERIEALGLQNVSISRQHTPLADCPCDDSPCRHIRTLEGPTPYQDDYLYASPAVAEALQLVDIERTAQIESVSDHWPLVADLED